MSSTTFASLAETILARPCAYSARLVAIDGGAGAGKTTFAAELGKALGGAPVIPMDDFLSLGDLTDWWARFETQVLAPLFDGKPCRYQQRDWVNDFHGDKLGEWREVPFSEVVILEGVGSSRRELGARLCYAVWIETPAERRLQRGLERDAAIAGHRESWQGWLAFEAAFFAADGTRERADLVVDGTRAYDGTEGSFASLEAR